MQQQKTLTFQTQEFWYPATLFYAFFTIGLQTNYSLKGKSEKGDFKIDPNSYYKFSDFRKRFDDMLVFCVFSARNFLIILINSNVSEKWIFSKKIV